MKLGHLVHKTGYVKTEVLSNVGIQDSNGALILKSFQAFLYSCKMKESYLQCLAKKALDIAHLAYKMAFFESCMVSNVSILGMPVFVETEQKLKMVDFWRKPER